MQFYSSVNKIESINLTTIGMFHMFMYWPFKVFFFLRVDCTAVLRFSKHSLELVGAGMGLTRDLDR